MYNKKIMENAHLDEWGNELPIQTENIAFKSDEMVGCAKCERANPPNRSNCIYCGAELEILEVQSRRPKPNLRKLEFWEKGFNLIFTPNSQISSAEKRAEIAKLLKMEREVLDKIIETGKTLPLARAESEKEAENARNWLLELGVETRILSDEILAIEKPTKRLRGIEFFDDKLILIFFNQDEIVEISNEDLVLTVTGAIMERKITATEKYNKKSENKILDATETASDDALIDIYDRRDSLGYRILAKGFDFSCLEAEKGILAKDNIRKLAGKLREVAPNAEFVDDYLQNRELLATVWEVEQKSDSQGLKREGFGKFSLGNITTVNNLSQFTKYSRLHWHLL